MYVYMAMYEIENPVDVREAIAMMQNLEGRIPEVIGFDVGKDKLGLPESCDVGMVVQFETFGGYSAFRSHKAILRVQTLLDRIAAKSHVVCFQSAEPDRFR